MKALQAGDTKATQLATALRGGNDRSIVLAANAVLLEVLPSAAADSTDPNPADTLDPLVGAALWDLVQTAIHVEHTFLATPPPAPEPATADEALAELAMARQAVHAAVHERDRLVAEGALRCP
ncbi:MAG: hypothetical protein ACP5VP_02385 [Candidatus Limnocylindrales bacterium]